MLPEMRVVRGGALGDAHQDPVARRRRQPHLEFVAWRSLKRTRIMALPVTVVGSSSINARPSWLDFDLRLARAVATGSGCR